MPEDRVLLAEAESGAVGVPAEAQPEPVQHHLVAELAEVRDAEAAADAAPHDALPAEHRLPSVELAEDRDAHLLDGQQVAETELVVERVVALERLVDDVALDHTELVGMEPLLDARLEVVLGGSRAFQLGVHHLVQPARVAGLGRTVHANREVQHGLGGGCRGGRRSEGRSGEHLLEEVGHADQVPAREILR